MQNIIRELFGSIITILKSPLHAVWLTRENSIRKGYQNKSHVKKTIKRHRKAV